MKLTLKHGFNLRFTDKLDLYEEQNNSSVVDNLGIVEDIITNWVEKGFVSVLDYKPKCVNPLTLVSQEKPNGKVKHRLVIDQSRYVNHVAYCPKTKLEDLKFREQFITKNCLATTLDLEDMFHQVRLAEISKDYFGFALPKGHKMQYYRFNVLQYGCKSAVHVVEKLLLPIKTYLRQLSVKFSMYIDDASIIHENKEELIQITQFVTNVLETAGWKINYEKSSLEPSTNQKYLGFFADTVKMKYFADQNKLLKIQALIENCLEKEVLTKKELAEIIGKIGSQRVAIGDLTVIGVRHCHQLLGRAVLQGEKQDWKGFLKLDKQAIDELMFMKSAIFKYNGRSINTQKVGNIVDVGAVKFWVDKIEEEMLEWQNRYFCSDASDSHVYFYEMDNLQETANFEFDKFEKAQSSGYREILAICKAIQNGVFKPSKVNTACYWYTDSQNLFYFLKKGSKKDYIQQKVIFIKKFELLANIRFVPVWVPRETNCLVWADLGSKIHKSTDEWGLTAEFYNSVLNYFKVKPSVDAFASELNTKCEKFFSLIPQKSCSGVNFFAQIPSSHEFYWICPPPQIVGHVFNHLIQFENIKGLLFIPCWAKLNCWPIITRGKFFHPIIQKAWYCKPSFINYTAAKNIFDGNKSFKSVILKFDTSTINKLRYFKC